MRFGPRGRVAAGVALAAIGLGALATNVGAQRGDPPPGSATAVLFDTTGAAVGRVNFEPVGGGSDAVEVRLSARNLPPGFHGFHVHAVGRCDRLPRPEPFASAGPHLNLRGAGHGGHNGDLPPVLVTDDGRSRAVTQTDEFRTSDLFDADGSAILVHAKPDNFANIPPRYQSGGRPGPDAMTLESGDSGDRIACGAILRR